MSHDYIERNYKVSELLRIMFVAILNERMKCCVSHKDDDTYVWLKEYHKKITNNVKIERNVQMMDLFAFVWQTLRVSTDYDIYEVYKSDFFIS